MEDNARIEMNSIATSFHLSAIQFRSSMPVRIFSNAAGFRAWLQRNHDKVQGFGCIVTYRHFVAGQAERARE